MVGGMDLFLFPSFYEGLGLALVEAQAAGLPCLISDRIPDEAILAPDLVRRISLREHRSAWVDAITAVRRSPMQRGVTASRALVERSAFTIEQSLARLTAFYDHSLEEAWSGNPGDSFCLRESGITLEQVQNRLRRRKHLDAESRR
jgi:glycosyltransferase involved in cell wall biosynthesis